jgi:hypothetical protein
MKKARVHGNTALLCQSESADVLRFTPTGAVVQGQGTEEFLLFRDGKITPLTVDFADTPQKEIDF